VEITALDEDAWRGCAAEDRVRLPVLPSAAVADRHENVLVPMEIAGRRDARRARAAPAGRGGPRTSVASLPVAALGRRAAAHGDRARAGQRPAVLLADEPTGNLDSSNGQHIIDLLLDINRTRNTTLVLVTHDPELAGVADESVALRDGHVVERAVRAGGVPIGAAP
jgi:putative ABC transport system ATP-binding protein